jgi:hypothetical protein
VHLRAHAQYIKDNVRDLKANARRQGRICEYTQEDAEYLCGFIQELDEEIASRGIEPLYCNPL